MDGDVLSFLHEQPLSQRSPAKVSALDLESKEIMHNGEEGTEKEHSRLF